MKDSHIFFAYSFDKDGKHCKLNDKKVAEELESEDLTFVHLDGNNKNAKKWVEKEVSYLDHLIIDALFAEETRPRIIKFENGILLILRAGNLNSSEYVEDMVSIRIWVDSSRIVSIQKRRFNAIFDLAKKIDEGKEIHSPGEFLYNLITDILNNTAPIASELNDKLDSIEEGILAKKFSDEIRESIINIRRKTIAFKRYLTPQKEIIDSLKNSNNGLIDDWAKRHFQENYDTITHILEEIDEAKERSQIVHNEISNALSAKLNKSLFKISLLSSIFMPLGFITGLFGMNVGGIPLSNSNIGFFAVISSMILALFFITLYIKKKKIF